MNTLHNKYYFQALDSYPYNLEDTLEALNYALSYDGEDSRSLCLMARVYSEVLQDYETAKHYFQEALQADMQNLAVYPYFADCLIAKEEYMEAKKLIKYSLSLPGINPCEMGQKKAWLYEKTQHWKKALTALDKAMAHACSDKCLNGMDDRKKLIKKKKGLMKKTCS